MKHINSSLAFIDTKGIRDHRKEDILRVFTRSDEPLTDRQVMFKLGYHDPNMVRPRISELIRENKIRQIDAIRDPESGRLVRACELRMQHVQLALSI